jgi:hypothetical protein
MPKSFILDPLWITKGSFVDSEYFTYILLDASIKYKKELEEGEIDRFNEVLFHSLNLNNLAVSGSIFTSKFKSVLNDPKIIQIKEDLKKLYDLPSDTSEIFKNANYVFINILLEHTNIRLNILDEIRMFYMNPKIHAEKEIFIVTNHSGDSSYKIWRLKEDKKKDLGFSFGKVRSVRVTELKENILKEELEKLEDPKLKLMSGQKNVVFAILEEKDMDELVAHAVKDLILLNKGLAKGKKFEPTLIEQLHALMLVEKIIPFTLDQWNFDYAKNV